MAGIAILAISLETDFASRIIFSKRVNSIKGYSIKSVYSGRVSLVSYMNQIYYYHTYVRKVCFFRSSCNFYL